MNRSKAETPFFARYLEGQDFPNVKTSIKAGGTGEESPPPQTLKYPSDTDEVSSRGK
ncbi:MAG TPA: microviridin/marinostatin family tricyclic proteinase inhibitor [Blastocatellia bacterium]|nr:microviridin/marinostatin family tricyclic proteinase inhibitor [Blastocatellia bacterium]